MDELDKEKKAHEETRKALEEEKTRKREIEQSASSYNECN